MGIPNVTAGLPKSREYGNPGYHVFMGCVNFYDTASRNTF